MMQGVFLARKKDGTLYYRSSITYRNKHISLGSYDSEEDAGEAYNEALRLIGSSLSVDDYDDFAKLDFKKWVSIVNFRDNGMYIKTPVYLRKKYFEYYLTRNIVLKFDADDLFYYSHHTIMKREGYLFVADYGMQVNILSRYGIRNHAVCGRDYEFANNDIYDYRYGNIVIINRYFGVEQCMRKGKAVYRTKVHITGDYIAGYYRTENEAAIAYNKAVDILKKAGVRKNFPQNYIEDISAKTYAEIYSTIHISKKIMDFKVNML